MHALAQVRDVRAKDSRMSVRDCVHIRAAKCASATRIRESAAESTHRRVGAALQSEHADSDASGDARDWESGDGVVVDRGGDGAAVVLTAGVDGGGREVVGSDGVRAADHAVGTLRVVGGVGGRVVVERRGV
eukprot:3325236-Pleurochrysis_carterae.AAC.1